MDICIEDKTITLVQGNTFFDVLKEALSGKRFKACVAARVEDTIYDLSTLVPNTATTILPVMLDSKDGLEILRHSTAHILATSVRRLFPQTKVTIGPSIENGFYYDFDPVRPFTIEDFAAIEAEMRHIVEACAPFEHASMTKKEALAQYAEQNEEYKVELINDITDETVSFYTLQDFVDLCRGPHLPHSGFAKNFKLLSVAGAYWRGSEKNKMLSRIYGTVFATEQELKAHLHQIEEAKRRDHRKLGRELDLFDFHEDVAPGMVFWHPKGMMLRTILEDFLRREHLKRGYELVQGPQILRQELWERSGHYENYRENMYFTTIEDDAYGVKPMNCLAHMLIYGSALRSYRELPVRYAEFGVVHRHEMSGALHGLLRVRQFTQDDAHIICTPEQLEEEIIKVIDFIRDLFTLFGFQYKIAVATRPEQSIGSDADWERATKALIAALEKIQIPFSINEGDGAFYGPKIDCRVTDSLGREWQCSTVQCDFTLPERFDLEYVGQDGNRHRPVMVHRAILGSIERFIGILIEHCAGAFPVWLAPVQARIVTVTSQHDSYALKILENLKKAGIRTEADTRNEKLGYKVRAAQVEKIPYVLVVGDKELEHKGVNVRLHGGDNLGFKTIEDIIHLIREASLEPFKQGGMHYQFS